MYKVIKRFYDLNANHAYSVGDTFPHNGVEGGITFDLLDRDMLS